MQLSSQEIFSASRTRLKRPARSCRCEMEPKALTSGLCMTQYLSITTTTKSSETKAWEFELPTKLWLIHTGGRIKSLETSWLHLSTLGSNPRAKSSAN